MKRIFAAGFLVVFTAASALAQADDDFFDDDLFGDDAITEVADVSAKTDLSKGILFENGSIKIGGSFSTGISTTTTLWADDDKDFGTHIKDSILSPTVSAYLSVDARPTQNLRMYTKFGIAYPFFSQAYSLADTVLYTNPSTKKPAAYTSVQTSVKDWLTLKELFTDFSVKDTAFFRFGLHTVTWGTGYFFSPVSDMINTSSINPEDVDSQVDGSLNLRTQITIPGSQNCLWLYLIPSTDFSNSYTFDSYVRDTAIAGKADLLFGGWELGVGAFVKYQQAPKAMLTASGSLKNYSLFGEFVYSYGAASEWATASDWSGKTSLFQATAGASRYWKDQRILAAVQYYFDSNNKDLAHQYFTYGHNLAAMITFGKLFGSTDFTATIFAMANFGKEALPDTAKTLLSTLGLSSTFLNTCTVSALLYYTPISEIKLGAGPYVTWNSFDAAPDVALRLSASLGGGKF